MIFLFDLKVWWLSIILFDELGLVLRNEVDEFVNKYKLILICKYKIIDIDLCLLIGLLILLRGVRFNLLDEIVDDY